MTQVVPYLFPQYPDVQAAYAAVNSLPVDYLRFALDAHYYGRLFGVILNETEGGSAEGDGFVVNACLRDALWRGLMSTTEQTEKFLGYNLSPRYHVETVRVTPSLRAQVEWPGIVALDVELAVSGLLASAALSPYVQIAAPLTTVDEKTIVNVSAAVVFNPRDIHLRSSVDGGTIEQVVGFGYPRRVGLNWQVNLNTQLHPLVVGETVNVQSKDFMFADVTPLPGQTLLPVYAGTSQIIPQARPAETLSSGLLRYWFYGYSLVDPAFYTDPVISLLNGEFYKLQAAVDFRAFTEVAVEERLDYSGSSSDGSDDRSWQVRFEIVDAAHGVVRIVILGEWLLNPLSHLEELRAGCADWDWPGSGRYALTLAYKTDPAALPPHVVKDQLSMLRALEHKVAADLPITDCGYDEKEIRGFIAEQQKSYSSVVTTTTGAQIFSPHYGDLHGHHVYAELLSHAAILRTRILR